MRQDVSLSVCLSESSLIVRTTKLCFAVNFLRFQDFSPNVFHCLPRDFFNVFKFFPVFFQMIFNVSLCFFKCFPTRTLLRFFNPWVNIFNVFC